LTILAYYCRTFFSFLHLCREAFFGSTRREFKGNKLKTQNEHVSEKKNFF
jgi:hypothetical protein